MKKIYHLTFIVSVLIIIIGAETYYVQNFDYPMQYQDSLANIDSSKLIPPVRKMYGIPMDDYNITTGKIKWNQNL